MTELIVCDMSKWVFCTRAAITSQGGLNDSRRGAEVRSKRNWRIPDKRRAGDEMWRCYQCFTASNQKGKRLEQWKGVLTGIIWYRPLWAHIRYKYISIHKLCTIYLYWTGTQTEKAKSDGVLFADIKLFQKRILPKFPKAWVQIYTINSTEFSREFLLTWFSKLFSGEI